MKVMSIAAVCVLLGPALPGIAFQSTPAANKSAAQANTTEGQQADLDRLQKETAARPDWIEGWWNLGTAAYDADRFDLAISALNKVVQVQPQMGIAWDLLGLSQFELEQYADARASLERASALGPIDDAEVEAVATYHLGMLRTRYADFQGAQAILQQHFSASQNPQTQLALGLAILRVPLLPSEVDPSHEALLLRIANATASGESGLAEFTNLVAANESVPILHLAYAEALKNIGRTDEAIQQLQLELKISPQSPTAWKTLSLAERKRGHIPEANAATDNALKFEAQEKVCEERSLKWFASQGAAIGDTTLSDGMRAYASGQYANAAKTLSAWVTSHPDDGTAWAVLGLSEYSLADHVNARLHLERGIAFGLHADAHAAATARYTLGILQLQAGDFESAAVELSAAHALDGSKNEIVEALGCVLLSRKDLPQVPTDPLTTNAGMIEIMLLESRYDQAFVAFHSLLASYPMQPNLHWAFGTALIALSEYDEAAEQMRAEQKISPNSPLPYIGLASIALRQHNPSNAIEPAQHAVELSPQSAESHYLFGRALLESSTSIPKAVTELQRAAQLNPNSPEIHFSLAKAYAHDSMPEQASKEREVFNHLNELRQTQNNGKADQTYAGPRQTEILSDTSNRPNTNP